MKRLQSLAIGPWAYVGQADLADQIRALLPTWVEYWTPPQIAEWDRDSPWGNVLILDTRDLNAAWLGHVISTVAQLPGTAVVALGQDHASVAGALPADQLTPWSLEQLLSIATHARQQQIGGERRDQDPLTGVMRRSVMQRELGLMLSAPIEADRPMAYLMIDLSGLKRVNLRRGEQAGDRCLQAIAQRLRSTLRLRDTLARIDGTVFGVLCRQIRNPMNVFDVVQKVQTALNEVIQELDVQALMTYSVGVAVYPDQGLQVAEVARSAELAMMRAKRGAPNEVRYFTRSMGGQMRRQQFVADGLRGAIHAEHLQMRYSPQLDRLGDKCVGISAQIEWLDPERGVQDTADWMQAAREAGLMREVTLWALGEVAHCAARVEGRIWLPLDLSLWAQREFEQALWRRLIEVELPPARLGFELAGPELNRLGRSVRPVLNKLYDAGVGLSVDHFASSAIDLELLNRLPVGAVKLSGDTVAAVGGGEEQILNAVLAMCQSLGLDVWADGVNSAYQHQRLSELGVDRVQGRLWAMGLSIDDLLEWLGSAEQAVQIPLSSS